MCDYSLHCIKTRLANEGEQLFIHRFYTGSKGLASVADWNALEIPQPSPPGTGIWGRFQHWINHKMRDHHVNQVLPAVCIPPGALLHLSDIPKDLQDRYGVGTSEDVIFAQLTLEQFQYRDAVRFSNGQEVLLQYLNEGLQTRVISLVAVEGRRQPPAVVQHHHRAELSVASSVAADLVVLKQSHLNAQLQLDRCDN
jgi:hypothetical protein